MAGQGDAKGFGKPFDFARVLATVPDAKETLQKTSAAIAAGDLIRRVRDRKGVSQPSLAKLTGITQPHISDLERGLGENGPTVGTLARLLAALGDELIVQSKQERAIWIAQLIDAAEASIGEIAEALAQAGVTDMTEVLSALANINKEETTNPLKNTLLNGIMVGIHMTLRSLSHSSVGELASSDVRDALAAVSQKLVEGDLAKGGFSQMFGRDKSEH